MREACEVASRRIRRMRGLLELEKASTLLRLRMVSTNCGDKRDPLTLHLFAHGAKNKFFLIKNYGDLMITVDRSIEEIESALQRFDLQMSLAFRTFYEVYHELAAERAPAELRRRA